MGDLRGICGGGFPFAIRMDGALVPQPETLQRVRREEGTGSDHLQCCFRLLLQSLSARTFRDHSHSFQRVTHLILPLTFSLLIVLLSVFILYWFVVICSTLYTQSYWDLYDHIALVNLFESINPCGVFCFFYLFTKN